LDIAQPWLCGWGVVGGRVVRIRATISPTTRNDVDGFRDIVHPPFRNFENLWIRLPVFYRLMSTIPTLFTPLL